MTRPLPADLMARIGQEPILLPYQQEGFRALEQHDVVIWEKSRRIGATWGVAAYAVLTAATERAGMDGLYMGPSLDMAREFIDTCAQWAKAYGQAASAVQEVVLKDDDDKEIKAYRIDFASGNKVLALSSHPRSLRGRQGIVIIDEAAFHDDLKEVVKASLALLIWGGKVIFVSTHNGAENEFNQMVIDSRVGKTGYHVIRTSFDDALEQGLYRRVCFVQQRDWSVEGEAVWAGKIRKQYGDNAAEELDVIPNATGGRYLNSIIIEKCVVRGIPVIRWHGDGSLDNLTPDQRMTAVRVWCDATIKPLLEALPKDRRHFMGEDFARSGDLTVLWPISLGKDLTRNTPFVIELKNLPFKAQEQIVEYVLRGLPRLSAAAFDAGGNGAALAEAMREKFGSLVHEIKFTEGWYRENMPRLKAALEDVMFTIPADAGIRDDFLAIEIINGVPRVATRVASGTDQQRHGDAAIAAVLALFAAVQDSGPIEGTVSSGTRETIQGMDDSWQGGADNDWSGY